MGRLLLRRRHRNIDCQRGSRKTHPIPPPSSISFSKSTDKQTNNPTELLDQFFTTFHPPFSSSTQLSPPFLPLDFSILRRRTRHSKMHLYTPTSLWDLSTKERERGAAAGDSMAPAQQPAEDLEKEKRPGGSPGGLGEEAREPAYCIRCGVGFLVAILLDIDRETHEYSLIRRGCVRRRSPLLSLYSFYARAHRCAHMHERSRTQVGNTRRDTRVHRGSVLRARVCSPQEEKYIYIYTCSVGRSRRGGPARCWKFLRRRFSVRGGGDYLENGDVDGKRGSRPSFIYRVHGGLYKSVAWRRRNSGAPRRCVSCHYILLHCVEDV